MLAERLRKSFVKIMLSGTTGLILLLSGTSSYAEDIEIYTGIFTAQAAIGTSPAEVNPNVLFILDNSGSMDSYRLLPMPPSGGIGLYDSTVDYGNDGTTNDDRVYVYFDNMNYTGHFATNTQNKCQAYRDWIAANPNNPVFFDRVAQWDRFDGAYFWFNDIITSSNPNDVFDCEDDRGDHGINSASSATYPENCRRGCNSSTPRYRSSPPSNNRNPYRRGSRFNLVPKNYHDYLSQLGGVSAGDVGDCTSDNQIVIIDPITGERGLCKKKIDIMQEALTNAIAGFSDINIALMDFNENDPNYNTGNDSSGEDGGTIIDAIGNINDATDRADFVTKVNGLVADGWTPLAESLYEGYRYFAGLSRDYGEVRDDNGAHRSGVSPITYKSPIINESQDNNIILLSDGLPTYDQDADGAISALVPGSCSFGSGQNGFGGDNGSESCLDDIAGYMRSNDMSTGAGGVRGDNNVYTYTIGFDIDAQLLEDTADAGRPPGADLGSGYFVANDLLGLENVFRRIIGQIQSVDSDTFVAPAVTVNAFNRLQNREDIYYVVFKPNTNARWNGNLKKYRVNSNATIVDQNGNNAISETTGFFLDTAQSFWSAAPDGAVVEDGGFAEQLGRNRPLFGSLDNTTAVTLLSDATSPAASVTRFLSLTADNPSGAINIGQITVGTPAEITANKNNIAGWTLGTDVDDELGSGDDQPNFFVADQLHGQPYVLSYGTSAADPRDIIFFTSNQGMLHAVTGQLRAGVPGGTEQWAYVPDASLFENFGLYYNRDADKAYGLDAEMSFLVERNPSTNAVTKANLFFGQRRGGDKLFAVNVTNAVGSGTPVAKLWTVDGGTGDFARMGQTWPEPVVAKMNYCTSSASNSCALRDVIIMSGGYDEAYDDDTVTVASNSGNVLGNAIYVIDAANGDLLWMAGGTVADSNRDLQIPEMTHSFPSKPTALDVNKDGAIDILFAIDVAGQVFRIDFKAGPTDDNTVLANNNSGKVAGGKIADLSETGDDRRFFNPVDVVLLPPDGDAPARYALVTGSGYRAHPLDMETFGNRLYVLFDPNIFEALYDEDVDASIDGDTDREPFYRYAEDGSSNPSIIDMDVASADLGEITNATTLDLTGTHEFGFYTGLSLAGEKIITPTLISDFRAIAVSYIPEAASGGGVGAASGTCTAGVGNSNAIELNLLTGETEVTELTKPGLTAEPVVVYILETDATTGEESLKPIVIIGTEPFEGADFDLTNLKLGKAEKRAWWESKRSN